MTGELIVSVSGIDNRTLPHLEDFHRLLDSRGVPLSLLVAPRRKHGYRLESDHPTVDWLTQRRSAGDAVVLYGFDEAATKRKRSEFATLPAHEANLRLMAADRVLEQIGMRTRLFAAPRWTVSKGTVTALPRNGFRLLIGLNGTTDLTRGTITRSRLLGIGAGFLTEPWWCATVVLAAGRIARRGGTVRLTVTGAQLDKSGPRQAVLDAVDLALMHGCRPTVYRCGERPARAQAS